MSKIANPMGKAFVKYGCSVPSARRNGVRAVMLYGDKGVSGSPFFVKNSMKTIKAKKAFFEGMERKEKQLKQLCSVYKSLYQESKTKAEKAEEAKRKEAETFGKYVEALEDLTDTRRELAKVRSFLCSLLMKAGEGVDVSRTYTEILKGAIKL